MWKVTFKTMEQVRWGNQSSTSEIELELHSEQVTMMLQCDTKDKCFTLPELYVEDTNNIGVSNEATHFTKFYTQRASVNFKEMKADFQIGYVK